MKASEVVQILKSSIAATKEAGVETVQLADLDAYAARLENAAAETPDDVAAGEAAMEKYRADLKAWISGRQHEHEHNLEMLRSVITVGQSALKSSLLINGGAAVALLAFVGQVWTTGPKNSILTPLAVALLHYVFGVLSAAVAAGATYLSQAGYGKEFGTVSMSIGRIGHFFAIAGVVVSYVLFGKGSWLAFLAVSGG